LPRSASVSATSWPRFAISCVNFVSTTRSMSDLMLSAMSSAVRDAGLVGMATSCRDSACGVHEVCHRI
jgi:hypothetical protein